MSTGSESAGEERDEVVEGGAGAVGEDQGALHEVVGGNAGEEVGEEGAVEGEEELTGLDIDAIAGEKGDIRRSFGGGLCG